MNNLNSNPFIQNSDSSNFQNFDKNNFCDKNNSSISGPLFNFRPNTQESNNVNPFLVNRNGFDLNSSNNSNNAFAMGVNKKKTQGNNYNIWRNLGRKIERESLIIQVDDVRFNHEIMKK